jgi:hypothetical protein
MLSGLSFLAGLLAAPLALGMALAKPEQIRSDSSPVFHYYLQRYKDSAYQKFRLKTTFAPFFSSFSSPIASECGRGLSVYGLGQPPLNSRTLTYLSYSPKPASLVVLGPAATGEYFNIGGTIQSVNSSLYINIGSDSTSYKTLTFNKTATTSAWGLEGDTIITTTASSYGRREYTRRASPAGPFSRQSAGIRCVRAERLTLHHPQN